MCRRVAVSGQLLDAAAQVGQAVLGRAAAVLRGEPIPLVRLVKVGVLEHAVGRIAAGRVGLGAERQCGLRMTLSRGEEIQQIGVGEIALGLRLPGGREGALQVGRIAGAQLRDQRPGARPWAVVDLLDRGRRRGRRDGILVLCEQAGGGRALTSG